MESFIQIQSSELDPDWRWDRTRISNSLSGHRRRDKATTEPRPGPGVGTGKRETQARNGGTEARTVTRLETGELRLEP